MATDQRTRLCIIDVQDRLLPTIADHAALLKRCVLLAKAAQLLGIETVATVQNPTGLGGTTSALLPYLSREFGKTTFSAFGAPEFAEWAAEGGTIILVGMEAHVCVLQTALALRAAGHAVACITNAVGSAFAYDRDCALERMGRHGVDLLSAEMMIFTWLERYDRPEFKPALVLIKELRALAVV